MIHFIALKNYQKYIYFQYLYLILLKIEHLFHKERQFWFIFIFLLLNEFSVLQLELSPKPLKSLNFIILISRNIDIKQSNIQIGG